MAKDRAKEFEPYLLTRITTSFWLWSAQLVGKSVQRLQQKENYFFSTKICGAYSVNDAQTNWQKFAIYGLQKVVEQFLQTMQGSAQRVFNSKGIWQSIHLRPPPPRTKENRIHSHLCG